MHAFSLTGKRMQTTPAERDMWVGGAPAPDRDLEKERLSKVMEVGVKGLRDRERREAERQAQALERTARNNPKDAKEALIDQVSLVYALLHLLDSKLWTA